LQFKNVWAYKRRGKKIRFLIDWMYAKIPLLGYILSKIDPIYVYHKPARLSWLNKLRWKNKQAHKVVQEVIKTIRHGELNCSCTRIILTLDIVKAYQKLKSKKNRIYAYLTRGIRYRLERKLAEKPTN
jgi:hypothetical protein